MKTDLRERRMSPNAVSPSVSTFLNTLIALAGMPGVDR